MTRRIGWAVLLAVTANAAYSGEGSRSTSSSGIHGLGIHVPSTPGERNSSGQLRNPPRTNRSRGSVSLNAGPGGHISAGAYYTRQRDCRNPYYPNAYDRYGRYPYGRYGYYGPLGLGGVYYDFRSRYVDYYLPPLNTPAEWLYGPLANDRFFGIERTPAGLIPGRAAAPDVRAAGEAAESVPALPDRLRKSNASSRARAARFVSFGNSLFREQRFHEAVQRYKSALVAAPDLADTYRREAFALIAVRQYSLAAKAFKIALQLDPKLIHDDFHLDDLYDGNHLAKSAHLELLAERALLRADDADLLLLVGLFLAEDGEMERGAKFLRRAVDLLGPRDKVGPGLLESTEDAGADATVTTGVGI